MNIIDTPSPSQGSRPAGVSPRLIVVHGTVGTDSGDLEFLKRGGEADNPVSYHYLVLRDGTVHRLVHPERRAWACGKSQWRGESDVNDFSISVGLSNLNDGKPYTDAQYKSLAWLCVTLMKHFPVPLEGIVGHYHVSPGRKTDPWYVFEWMRLSAEMQKVAA